MGEEGRGSVRTAGGQRCPAMSPPHFAIGSAARGNRSWTPTDTHGWSPADTRSDIFTKPLPLGSFLKHRCSLTYALCLDLRLCEGLHLTYSVARPSAPRGVLRWSAPSSSRPHS
eukprot:scaffold2557_cov135-Isochrysis_galbana.AAC.1